MRVPSSRAALVAATIAVLSPQPAATATPPGGNGRLAIAGGTFSRQDLRSVLPDGSRPRRLTSTPNRNEGRPRWSPDGARIVLSAGAGDTFGEELFVMTATGERVRKLTDNRALDTSPDWSPHGRRIVFIRGRRSRSLYVMRADGSRVRRIDYDGYVGYWARWSPSGRRIAFEGIDDVFTIRLDGTGRRRITRGITRKPPGSDGDTFGGIDGLDWSPDSKWILVAAHRGESDSYVYKVRSDGGRPRRLARGREAVWSPNGRAIAFVRGHRRVVVKNLARSTARTVATAREFASSVAWQPR